MIRYRYAEQLDPPAPFLLVTLRCPTTGSRVVEIHVHDWPPLLVRGVLGESEPHILLGRDVLNAHYLVLDGPQLALGVDRPSAG